MRSDQKYSDTFCVLPWIHMATWTDGSALLCCVAKNSHKLNLNNQLVSEIWNSDHFKDARIKMLAGEKISACDHCYKEESAGIRSHRKNENALWLKNLGQEYIDELISSTNDDGYLDKDVITFDFRLGNTCNLQCVMCRPQDSSKWLNDAKKLSQILETEAKWDWKHKSEIDTSQFEWYKKDKIWSDFEHLLPNIRHMIFAGGEPLLIKEHHSLIKKLVESGYSKNIELRYHTNGTIMEQDFIDLWKEFKQVELMVSIDAWGEQNDYVRYPAKWDTILNNLSILDETPDNINIMMLASIHAMNIFDIPLLAKNSLDRGFKKINKKFHKGLFHPGTVHWPNYMCTKIFPKEIKEKIVERWNDFDQYLIDNPQWSQKIKKQLDFMLSEDWSNLFPSFLEYINKLDKIRGTSYSKTFPEFSKILKEYGDIDG